jgi:hypothetical protein
MRSLYSIGVRFGRLKWRLKSLLNPDESHSYKFNYSAVSSMETIEQ